MDNQLIDLVHQLDARAGPDAAYAITAQYFGDLGFNYVNVGLVSASDQSYLGLFSNMRPSWLDHYVSAEYASCDVIFDLVVSQEDAFLASPRANFALPSTNRALSDRMLTEIQDEGFISSLVLPRHSQISDRLIGFNLGSDLGETAFTELVERNRNTIMLGAALTQTAIIEDYEGEALGDHWIPIAPAELTLSQREAEVLKWLSQGLRNDRIAEKLGITAATVNFHLGAARKKLGARTREQAVAIAIAKKLIF